MDEQVARIMINLRDLPSDLERYIALNSLPRSQRGPFLSAWYATTIDEIQPLIYTPTVGPRLPTVRPDLPAATRHVSLAPMIAEASRNCLPTGPIRPSFIVVTDGERILGLGDLGAPWHGHPGRQAFRSISACAGIHPEYLPARHAGPSVPTTRIFSMIAIISVCGRNV